jgi:hypothetical protein
MNIGMALLFSQEPDARTKFYPTEPRNLKIHPFMNTVTPLFSESTSSVILHARCITNSVHLPRVIRIVAATSTRSAIRHTRLQHTIRSESIHDAPTTGRCAAWKPVAARVH